MQKVDFNHPFLSFMFSSYDDACFLIHNMIY